MTVTSRANTARHHRLAPGEALYVDRVIVAVQHLDGGPPGASILDCHKLAEAKMAAQPSSARTRTLRLAMGRTVIRMPLSIFYMNNH
jgi:hypothetical protein